MNNILESLSDDKNYYGEYGQQFLSNSDIGMLLSNPKQFRKPRPESKPLLEGRYFHTAILEPDKIKNFTLVDCASRNTKVYKEAIEDTGEQMLMLTKEAEEIDALTKSMTSNFSFYESIYADGNKYEVPGVQEIKGHMWKGKCDIVMPSEDVLIDLKTTGKGKLDNWRFSAKTYNYDSQCYIYQMIFGKPLIFYVIEKETHRLAKYTPSVEFIRGGEQKVERALEVYKQFFAEDSVENVDNYFISEVL
jgi:hypothetical protein